MVLGILKTVEELSKKETSYDVKGGKVETLVELDFTRFITSMLDHLLNMFNQRSCIILDIVLLLS